MLPIGFFAAMFYVDGNISADQHWVVDSGAVLVSNQREPPEAGAGWQPHRLPAATRGQESDWSSAWWHLTVPAQQDE